MIDGGSHLSVHKAAIPAGTFGGRTPAGRGTFKNGSVFLGSIALTGGVASLTTAALPVGTDSITAVYSGNANILGSTSAPLSQVVSQATSTTTLISSQNPASFGQSVTFAATVAPQFRGTPAGNLVFKDGFTILATVTLTGGVATYSTSSLTSGSHTIKARYQGRKTSVRVRRR